MFDGSYNLLQGIKSSVKSRLILNFIEFLKWLLQRP